MHLWAPNKARQDDSQKRRPKRQPSLLAAHAGGVIRHK